MNGTGSPFAALVSSRKFWVVALALVVVGVGLGLGRITAAEALSFAKWIVAAWLGAVATEDAARNLATRPSQSVTAVAQSSQDAPTSTPPAPSSSAPPDAS